MAKKFLTSINLDGNELVNAVVQNVSNDPSSPKRGMIWFNVVAGLIKYFDGTSIKVIPLDAGPTSFTQTIGDGSATSITVTHNLGTRDLIAQVRSTNTPFDKVEPDIEFTDDNTITVKFATAPTNGQYRVLIKK